MHNRRCVTVWIVCCHCLYPYNVNAMASVCIGAGMYMYLNIYNVYKYIGLLFEIKV